MAQRETQKEKEWEKLKARKETRTVQNAEGAGARQERGTVKERQRQAVPVALCDKDIM